MEWPEFKFHKVENILEIVTVLLTKTSYDPTFLTFLEVLKINFLTWIDDIIDGFNW